MHQVCIIRLQNKNFSKNDKHHQGIRTFLENYRTIAITRQCVIMYNALTSFFLLPTTSTPTVLSIVYFKVYIFSKLYLSTSVAFKTQCTPFARLTWLWSFWQRSRPIIFRDDEGSTKKKMPSGGAVICSFLIPVSLCLL